MTDDRLREEPTAGDEHLIRRALAVAAAADPRDVPVGAVVFAADGTELAAAANAREETGDPTAHAEVLALREAARVVGDGWRLAGATLAVTVEPCTMCAGALVLARVERLVFGAWEPKTGAVGSLWDVVRDRRLTHRPQVRGGVLADECGALLEEFFAGRRSVRRRAISRADLGTDVDRVPRVATADRNVAVPLEIRPQRCEVRPR